MEQENQEEIEKVLPSDTTQVVETPAEAVVETPEQDPLKTELERVQRKGRTKAEKLLYTKRRVDEQLKELGIEDEPEEDEDDKPVTVGMLKKINEQSATKSALQMADEVTSETERELLKYHLENTIRSTGNPQQDFDLARGLVNAVKNKQIMEQTGIRPNVQTHASGPGAPARIEKEAEFTAEELSYMKPPFNMTKEQILAARPK